MQGAKRSNARRQCEHLQRRSVPVSRGQHRSDFSDSVDWLADSSPWADVHWRKAMPRPRSGLFIDIDSA
jgi:hypothetical protein